MIIFTKKEYTFAAVVITHFFLQKQSLTPIVAGPASMSILREQLSGFPMKTEAEQKFSVPIVEGTWGMFLPAKN